MARDLHGFWTKNTPNLQEMQIWGIVDGGVMWTC